VKFDDNGNLKIQDFFGDVLSVSDEGDSFTFQTQDGKYVLLPDEQARQLAKLIKQTVKGR
jgi:hypothetical protein